jgi:hypothetical protein
MVPKDGEPLLSNTPQPTSKSLKNQSANDRRELWGIGTKREIKQFKTSTSDDILNVPSDRKMSEVKNS